ncbi:MAG: YjbQ family protein [Candidatus Marinimicrobia bacterium]|nr:YjbQ family protein [Candidatus Neomarinimicrobiota bacterium]MBL7023688.1 YjbQ family protein [Candidatus Neomarinimicrobiota bacterium]
MVTLSVSTSNRVESQDITHLISQEISSNNWDDGILTIYCPHTTGAITINESADPDVVKDMTMEMNNIVPFDDGYLHSEGNSAAHIKSSLIGCSETVIVENGNTVLGTWQGVYFAEFDGPRTRKVLLKFVNNK